MYDDNFHFNTQCTSSSLGTERMCIRSSGNVGIGTALPDARMDVNGYVMCKGFLCYDWQGIFYKGLRVQSYNDLIRKMVATQTILNFSLYVAIMLFVPQHMSPLVMNASRAIS